MVLLREGTGLPVVPDVSILVYIAAVSHVSTPSGLYIAFVFTKDGERPLVQKIWARLGVYSLFVAKGEMTSQLKLWWYLPACPNALGKVPGTKASLSL